MKEKATILEINNIYRILTLVSKKVSTVTKSTMVFGEWDSVAPQNVQIRVSFSVFVGSFSDLFFPLIFLIVPSVFKTHVDRAFSCQK